MLWWRQVPVKMCTQQSWPSHFVNLISLRPDTSQEQPFCNPRLVFYPLLLRVIRPVRSEGHLDAVSSDCLKVCCSESKTCALFPKLIKPFKAIRASTTKLGTYWELLVTASTYATPMTITKGCCFFLQRFLVKCRK